MNAEIAEEDELRAIIIEQMLFVEAVNNHKSELYLNI